MSELAKYLLDKKGDRSIDDIAKRARESGHPVSRSVVAKYLRGEHGPRVPEETILGLAAGFGVDPRTLRELAGRPAGELGPYVPTAMAASLTQAQRDALDNLIQAFVKGDATWSGNTSPEDEAASVGGEGVPRSLRQSGDTTPGNIRPLSPRQQRMLDDAQPVGEAAYGDDFDPDAPELDEFPDKGSDEPS